MFVQGVEIDDSKYALADLGVEAIGISEGALCPGDTPLHRRPQRRLTSS
jgi:hypothetical protein